MANNTINLFGNKYSKDNRVINNIRNVMDMFIISNVKNIGNIFINCFTKK